MWPIATLAVGKWPLALLLCMAGTACGSDSTLRGRFYWGHEVQAFHPCGANKAYWVKGEKRNLESLRDHTEKLRERRGKPYQPIYIEALGAIDTKSRREGFAADYDGLFNLRNVVRISSVIPNDCAVGVVTVPKGGQ
jgi:hypothetical protein